MTGSPISIERLDLPANDADVRELATLLVEAVSDGAAVSFLAPLSLDAAADWWQRTLTAAHPRAIFLVARHAGSIVGTVQLQPAWAPNQPHRGEVVKLLVANACRRRGLGAALMGRLEEEARTGGFRLLTLDAKAGGAAERLYHRLGWIPLGTIPKYALDPDGMTPHGAVFFYKNVR